MNTKRLNSMQVRRMCLAVAAMLVMGWVNASSAQARFGIPLCASCCSNDWPYLSGWAAQKQCDTLNVYVCDYTEGLHSVTIRADSPSGTVLSQAHFYLSAPPNGICGVPSCMYLSFKLPAWFVAMDRDIYVNATSPNPYISQGPLGERSTGVSPVTFEACSAPTPTKTPTATKTRIPTPVCTRTATPIRTPTATRTPISTPVCTKTPVPVCSKTPTPQPTPSPTPEMATFALTPIVECVDDNQNGNFTARFGYRNDGDKQVDATVGAFNGFFPAPIDRGQPETFKPGLSTNVFSTVFPAGSTLAWKLGDAIVKASESSKRCTGPICEEVSIGEIQTSLDTNALKQDANVKQFVRRIKRNAGGNKALLAAADSLKRRSAALYQQQWEGIWTQFSSTIVHCEGVGCVQIDQQDNIDTVIRLSAEHLALSASAAKTLQRARGGILERDDKRLLGNAQTLHKENKTTAEEIPRFESQCS